MSYTDDLWADDHDDEPYDDWYDDDDPQSGYEPDPEDAEIEREYAEYYDHCDKVHGGEHCDCRPSRLARLVAAWRDGVRRAGNRWWKVRSFTRQMHTVRVGPVELTVRFRPPVNCGACGGRGWFYTVGTVDPMPMPAGHDGTSLCGCGSAIARLADSRRYVREAPPF